MTDERAEFEANAVDRGWAHSDLDRYSDGPSPTEYRLPQLQDEWEIWTAARVAPNARIAELETRLAAAEKGVMPNQRKSRCKHEIMTWQESVEYIKRTGTMPSHINYDSRCDCAMCDAYREVLDARSASSGAEKP